jgi:diguanylate cyclase (GGDEF)-like protein/PAS domain S-box-containing protein
MKNKFEKLANYSFDMLAILDLDGSFVFVNRAFSERLGWSNHDLTGRNLQELMVFTGLENSSNMFKNLSRGHPILFSEVQFKHKNESLSPMRLTAYPDLDELAVFLVIHEMDIKITDHAIFKMAIESSPTVIFIVKDGRFLYANLFAEKVFGYSQDEFIGQTLEMLIPPRLHGVHQNRHSQYVQQPYTRLMGSALELPGMRKDGTEIPLDIGLNPVYSPSGLMVVCSIIDITKRKEAENIAAQKIVRLESEIVALDHLSLTDELTSLLNRRALFKYLELHYRIAQRESRPVSLILADIDDFKGYNDTFGHIAGDEALKLFAQLLMASFRKTDVVCRYGGDEMAVILPATDVNEARVMCERLQKETGEFEWPHRRNTLSVGVATLLPRLNQTASLGAVNNFIIMADMALYASKRSGRNKAFHYNDIGEISGKQLADWKTQRDAHPDR